jgi:hypothetical protein
LRVSSEIIAVTMHAGAQPLNSISVAHDGDAQRGAADALNQQSQIDNITHSAWNLEVAFDVNDPQWRTTRSLSKRCRSPDPRT